MKKKDLKTGMQVELRSGERYVVMIDTPTGNVLVNIQEESSAYLSLYNDNLFHLVNRNLNIVRIYRSVLPFRFFTKLSKANLVWQRKTEIEVTVKINGKTKSPSELSKETWNNLRSEK